MEPDNTEEDPGERASRIQQVAGFVDGFQSQRRITEAVRADRPIDAHRRGQARVLGFTLVVAIAVAGAVLVILLGSVALNDAHDSISAEQAELDATSLDNGVTAVAGGSQSSYTQLISGALSRDHVTVNQSAGSARLWIEDASTGTRTEVMVTNLGTVTYETNGDTIGVQAGGVWRGDGDGGSTMVSPPDLYRGEDSFGLPLITIHSGTSGSSKLAVARGDHSQYYPRPGTDQTNPISEGTVGLTIQSDYYRAWGAYFEQRDFGPVTLDHENHSTTVELTVVGAHDPVEYAATGAAAAGDLRLSGTGAHADSYDSLRGNYSATGGLANGTIASAGNVTISGTADVLGNIRSGNAVHVTGTGLVTGTVYWTENFTHRGTAVYGGDERIQGFSGPRPIDWYVNDRVASIRADNDNNETTAIENGQVNFSAPTTELQAGEYYLENLTVRGDTLVLNATGGDVHIAVRDYVRVEAGGSPSRPGTVLVKGDHDVNVFVAGDQPLSSPSGHGATEVGLYVGSGGTVDVPLDRANRMWVYGGPDFNATIDGPVASFTGVVYAPSGPGGAGQAVIRQGQVFGGVVTGSLDIQQFGAIHYDQALDGVEPLSEPPHGYVPELFLHASTTSVILDGPTVEHPSPTATATQTPVPSTPAPPSPPTVDTFTLVDASVCSGLNTEQDACLNTALTDRAELTVTWTVTDANRDLSTATVTISDGTTTLDSYTAASGTETFVDAGGYGDAYTVQLTATDDAGNQVCEELTVTANGTSSTTRSNC